MDEKRSGSERNKEEEGGRMMTKNEKSKVGTRS